jgi:hypothetical protein
MSFSNSALKSKKHILLKQINFKKWSEQKK